MEKLVKNLFDYQKIAKNEKLEKITEETFDKYGNPLDEADLVNVSAGARQSDAVKRLEAMRKNLRSEPNPPKKDVQC